MLRTKGKGALIASWDGQALERRGLRLEGVRGVALTWPLFVMLMRTAVVRESTTTPPATNADGGMSTDGDSSETAPPPPPPPP